MSGKVGKFGGKNRGKKDTRKYLNGKQGKTDEIRRALTHRARLRKNYFKLLEREGLDVPSKESTEIRGNVEEESTEEKDSHEEGPDDGSDDSSRTKKSALSGIDIIKQKVKNHEPLTFQERIQLKKDRRENDKKKKMQKTREKLEALKKSELKRKQQTERIQGTKTRKGQPLMGPRINDLLDKIKQEKNT